MAPESIQPAESWTWTQVFSEHDLKADALSSLPKVGKYLVALCRAIAIPARRLPNEHLLHLIDDTDFREMTRIEPVASSWGQDPKWIVAYVVDPRSNAERVAAVKLEYSPAGVSRWKTLVEGLDHCGSVCISDHASWQWLKSNAGDTWKRELSRESEKRGWKWAAGASPLGGAFIRTSGGYGDGSGRVWLGLDANGACVCVVFEFEMDLERLGDIATEQTRKAPETFAAQDLAKLDQKWAASTEAVDVPRDFEQAFLADFARTSKYDASFPADALVFLRQGGAIEDFTRRIRAMYQAWSRRIVAATAAQDIADLGAGPFHLTFNYHGGPNDVLHRRLVALLPPTSPMLGVRLGMLFGAFESDGDEDPKALPWCRGGLSWLTPLLYAGESSEAHCPVGSPLLAHNTKPQSASPSAGNIETWLARLEYPPEALLLGALESDLDNWRWPRVLGDLPGVAPYIEKFPILVEAVSQSQVVRRQIYVLETLRYAGVSPEIANGLGVRLVKDKRKTLARKAREWVDGCGGPLPTRFEPR